MAGSEELHAGDTPLAEVVGALAAYADRVPGGASSCRRALVDTFDWRLHDAGLALELEAVGDGAQAVLRGADGVPEPRVAIPVEAVPAAPGAPVPLDLLPDRLRARLVPLLDLRAPLARAVLDVDRVELRHRNADQKTVAWVAVEALRVRGAPAAAEALPVRVRIEPIRGYERAAERLTVLLAAELGLAPLGASERLAPFVLAGCRPGDYSGRFDVDLDPDDAADHALAGVLLHLLTQVERNEPGVRADLDTEFLHDLRVAVRRTRSLLPVARGVFGADALASFVGPLRSLAAATGPARDLDVHLLDFDATAAHVPAEWREALEPMRSFLTTHREQAYADLVAVLDGREWSSFRSDWRRFLASAGTGGDESAEATPPRSPTMGAVAAGAVRRAHRRLLRDGRRIDASSPPEALHELRKRAKVLRYRLEALGGALVDDPEHDVDTEHAIRELKGLQDVLGAYQDAHVQIDTLRRFAAQMAAEGVGTTDTFLAMGILVARLDRHQRRIRRRFAGAFHRFDRGADRRLYRALTAAADDAGGGGARVSEEVPGS